ncbi:MAG TPA: NTP transferase domain-containing protein [Nitrospirales bacterium]|nr:NTP transferase domain-containing protein [Nitrospirales bacterium]
MELDYRSVTALVLAGSRSGRDPVAQMAGVSTKVLAQVGGEPMISRVLQTLDQSRTVGKRILCGPSWETIQNNPFLGTLIESGAVQWVEPQQGPSLSVARFLDEQPQEFPILVTTADHALLTAEMVDYFLHAAQEKQMDVAVGLVPYSSVVASYPQSKRTVTRLTGGGFCGCNLFVLCTPKAKRMVEFWSQVERERKHPIRLIRTLGGLALVRYLFGWLSLAEALNRLGQKLNLQVQEVLLPFPEAAIDVDTPEDLALAEAILAKRQEDMEKGVAPS